jgi:hypothetical protein
MTYEGPECNPAKLKEIFGKPWGDTLLRSMGYGLRLISPRCLAVPVRLLDVCLLPLLLVFLLFAECEVVEELPDEGCLGVCVCGLMRNIIVSCGEGLTDKAVTIIIMISIVMIITITTLATPL